MRTPSSYGGMTAADCPSDELLGAHVRRALDLHDSEMVSSHLDRCDACREVVVAAVRGGVVATTLAAGTPADLLTEPRRHTATFARGRRLGRYEIRELLGAGGMGQVYAAHDSELDRMVALKVLHPELSADNRGLVAERLIRESRAMAQIAHPSVITVYDVGSVDGVLFIAMELIRGDTLGNYVRRTKPAWKTVVALLERAGAGLAAAHANGIIHRDFKPDNVLLELRRESPASPPRRVVVTDFGVAHTLNELPTGRDSAAAPARDVALTATGMTIGTPAYMSPEQLRGDTLDRRVDVFAFAVSAWELLFGERPFKGDSLEELRRAMQRPPAPPANRRVPGRLVDVVRRGLAREVDQRFATMDEFVAALATVCTARRRRITAAISSAAITGLVAVGAVTGRSLVDPTPDPCEIAAARVGGQYLELARARAVLAAVPGGDEASQRLAQSFADWQTIHAATCNADREPAQAVDTAACLDARRTELIGALDDIGSTPGQPLIVRFAELVGDPTACQQDPAPGLKWAAFSEDPVLRRRVAEIRLRIFAIEDRREHGATEGLVDEARRVVDSARPLWPPAYAEALYALGTAQANAGATRDALATLHEAAVFAERIQHDHIATAAWSVLISLTAFDGGDPTRALGFVGLAEAALARIGHKPVLVFSVRIAKAAVFAQLNRNREAEAEYRAALSLAEQQLPRSVAVAVNGLGFALEGQGRYDEAVALYRRAIGELSAHKQRSELVTLTFQIRLAAGLEMLGRGPEAERVAGEAVAVADRLLPESNMDRAIAHTQLAQVLERSGKAELALREAIYARDRIAAITDGRGTRYAETLLLEGLILNDLGRFREADDQLERACTIFEHAIAERSEKLPECWMQRAVALSGLERPRDAYGFADKLVPAFTAVYGSEHPQVASALVVRGGLAAELHHTARAIDDLERAVAMFERLAGTIDEGHLGGAKSALGQAIYPRDHKRGRLLIQQAIQHFRRGSGSWEPAAKDAEAWLTNR